jgi:Uma2 family endonuclease
MATKTALTWAEFLAAGKEGQRWEYVDGEVKFMSPSGLPHGLVIDEISVAVHKFVSANPGWVSVPTDVAFRMESDNLRCPDWSRVWRERLAAGIPSSPAPSRRT